MRRVYGVVAAGPCFDCCSLGCSFGLRNRTEHSAPLSSSSTSALEIDELIDAALDTTAKCLHFSVGKVSSDPAILKHGGAANCIGYAALFKAILQKELSSSGHADTYVVEHVIGQLHIGDWNMHSAFNSPFWKDHDIVRITDGRIGSVIYVDPTLYDAFGIGRVSGP